jgi:hypothetical protein
MNKYAELPDLTDKRAVILGLQGSGKSELGKCLTRSEPAHLVYDVHHEYTGFNRYLVEHRQVRKPGDPKDPAIDELNNLVERVIFEGGRIRRFTMDEANRYCPGKYPLPSSILTLNDDNRHDKVSFIAIARRAVQLNADLVELAHYLFIFRLPGKNDRQYLEGLSEGLGDAVRELQDYHFMVVDPRRQYSVHLPIDIKSG